MVSLVRYVVSVLASFLTFAIQEHTWSVIWWTVMAVVWPKDQIRSWSFTMVANVMFHNAEELTCSH